jgi:hypothetical protein
MDTGRLAELAVRLHASRHGLSQCDLDASLLAGMDLLSAEAKALLFNAKSANALTTHGHTVECRTV